MGGIWLHDLPAIIAGAGLDVDVWPGWETRARSSGGYDDVRAIGIHHDAGVTGTSLEARCRYAWEVSDTRPIGAMWLHTDGRVMVGAAGATNTQGKGGPVNTSRGTIPIDQGNRYMLSIEASNNGVGEPWPTVMQDAYVTLVAALVDALGLEVGDVFAHFEWTTRKIDPAGPSRYATGSSSWNMDWFRSDVWSSTPTPPTPTPPGDTDMASTKLVLCDVRDPKPAYLCGDVDKTWISDGNAMAQVLRRLDESKGGTVPSPTDGFVYKRLDHGGDDVIASYGPISGDVPPGRDRFGRKT